MNSDHDETRAREFEAAARAQHGAAGQALDEHRMRSGEVTWLSEGQHGQMWAVCWQPDRAESNLRVWPVGRRGRPGRTHMRLPAASYADARATAERLGRLLASPRPADFSDVADPGSQQHPGLPCRTGARSGPGEDHDGRNV